MILTLEELKAQALFGKKIWEQLLVIFPTRKVNGHVFNKIPSGTSSEVVGGVLGQKMSIDMCREKELQSQQTHSICYTISCETFQYAVKYSRIYS